MTHDLIGLPAFSCIGLEKTGPSDGCHGWVPQLWTEFVKRSAEIKHLAREGVWGLMSDSETFLAPWTGPAGRYLAGTRVARGTQPFGDWKVWDVPGSCWMRIPLWMDQYDEALEHMRAFAHASPDWRREGALHEFYPDQFLDPARDLFYLMAPLVPRDALAT